MCLDIGLKQSIDLLEFVNKFIYEAVTLKAKVTNDK